MASPPDGLEEAHERGVAVVESGLARGGPGTLGLVEGLGEVVKLAPDLVALGRVVLLDRIATAEDRLPGRLQRAELGQGGFLGDGEILTVESPACPLEAPVFPLKACL